MKINNKDYVINRDTAKVTEWDKTYCNILKEIIDKGELTPNRTGIETIAIPNINFKLDVGENFPILETKKVAMKNSITELLWIYQAQTNDINWLHERDNHIWDDWVIDDDGIYRIYDPFINRDTGTFVKVRNYKGKDAPIYARSKKDNKTITDAIYFGKNYARTIGTAYGDIVRRTGEFDNVLKTLKTDPRSRRMVVSLRQADYLKTGVLEPCVWAHSYKLFKGKLNSNVEIRSNDMPIGNPFNVTQYAVLLSLLAKTSNLEVGEISFDITDCHIYVNQLKAIKIQLERFDRLSKWENFIKLNSDESIEREYKELLNRKEYLNKKLEENKYLKEDYVEIVKEVNEEIMCFEHLIIRENPELYINPNKDFYSLDNKKDNDDIKILKYSSLPFIKMPVAQ